MTSVFLPDFVGYPLCYLGLQANLPPEADAVLVDYNAHWPYRSLPALVDAIASRPFAPAPRAIVGYSFGAHVAVLLAERLSGAGAPPTLVLIDPPSIASMPRRDAAAIESLLRSRDDYGYVFDAIECDLTSVEAVVANIEMLSRLPPRRRLGAPATVFVAGGAAAAAAVLAEWEVTGDAPEVICLEHCDHRSILQAPVVSARLLLVAGGRASGR